MAVSPVRTRSAESYRSGGARRAESLGTQIVAAVGYTTVIVTLAIVVFASFTDDFGLDQALIACPLVAVACLAAIRRRARP
jgi:hypothetical protein